MIFSIVTKHLLSYPLLHLRRIFLSLSFFLIAAGLNASAQPVQVPKTPEIHANDQVTFYFPDPGASKVLLSLTGVAHPLPMKNNGQGLWSITVGPLQPEIYSYSFVADGIPRLDPSNSRIDPNLQWSSNAIEVPAATPQLWDVQNVPHGVVHQHFYKSTIVGDERDYFVYTPPGYNPCANKKYPVLYLLHGYTDDARGWTAIGRANVILDNLMAAGKVRPMIVVMPLGYGAPEFVTGPNADFDNAALRQRNFALFTQTLLTEVMPRVQSEYRVSTKREDTAIAGLSMGGGESLLTGLNNMNTFAWIGSFSGAGINPPYAQDFPTLNAKSAARLRLLWIACGTNDRYVSSRPLITANRELVAWLRSSKIPVTFVQTPGMHEWPVWRNNLIHFAPLLFQQK